ncbi:MAG: type II toxin-antitoxin system VapC family toxin [Micrococcales bacterium]|nr:type II toxin-antitoxin system VapC family toxin [Micrococcales bacterium]
MVFYVDTSALAKLVAREEHSTAIRRWWRANQLDSVSSRLATTELIRSVRRLSPDLVPSVNQVLDGLELVEIEPMDFDVAANLEPPVLRSLDALHLAAALDLRPDLAGLVTYDRRLANAATLANVEVVAPA